MIEVTLRDSSIKAKKLRREGLTTGTIRRINGDIIPISMSNSEIDKYLNIHGKDDVIDLKLGDEMFKGIIEGIERDLLIHNTANLDFKEIK